MYPIGFIRYAVDCVTFLRKDLLFSFAMQIFPVITEANKMMPGMNSVRFLSVGNAKISFSRRICIRTHFPTINRAAGALEKGRRFFIRLWRD
jgi:hypothetical protein